MLCASMILLGIFSGPAAADNIFHPAKCTDPGLSPSDTAYWYNLIDRNSDYTGPVVFGVKNNISGFIATSLNYQSKRSSYSSDAENSKGSTSLSITNPELYFDSQVNDWTLGHIALSYSNDFNNATFGQTDMFFTEANVVVQNFTNEGHFWSKIGMQYLNFGSEHSGLFSNPLTFNLYQTNAPAVTVGVVKLNGFYGDGFIYNGVPYGTGTPQINDNSNNIHGYGLDLGYIGGTPTNGFNLVADYLADLNTTLMMHWNNYSNKITPSKQIPGDAFDAYYHVGPWAFDASYVSALVGYDSTQYKFNNQGARPAAYALETDYNFGTAHPQTLALGYQQSKDMLGLNVFGGFFPVPKSRIDFTYFYTIMTNMTLNFEVQNNQDYGTSDTGSINNGSTAHGTGNNYNYVGLGYKLIF
jgi:hypothetical protein